MTDPRSPQPDPLRLNRDRLYEAHISVEAGYIQAPDRLARAYWRKVADAYDRSAEADASRVSEGLDPVHAATPIPSPDTDLRDVLENDLRELWAATPAELSKRLIHRGWTRLSSSESTETLDAARPRHTEAGLAAAIDDLVPGGPGITFPIPDPLTETLDAAPERPTLDDVPGRCDGCGGPHPFDTSVPSPLWNRVIRDGGLPDFLCTTCIVLAFVRAGESFEAELYGPPVDRTDATVPTITVTVDERPMAYSYGDLDYELRTLRAELVAAARLTSPDSREQTAAPRRTG